MAVNSTVAALDLSSGNGHLEVVKWLHHNREEGCTAFAMDLAADNVHFKVFGFLHLNRTEGYSFVTVMNSLRPDRRPIYNILNKK
jgi:hypothetical protein